jgi:acyl-CoA thioesterase-2
MSLGQQGHRSVEPSFADVIAVEHLGDDQFRAADPRQLSFFLGGKELAAAVGAAATTLSGDMRLFSLVSSFVGRRHLDAPLLFRVRRVSDGRSFSTREIEASTDAGAVWFKAMATFHAGEEGVDQQVTMPPATRPEELLSAEEEATLGDARPRNAVAFPWDADFELRFEHVDDRRYAFWARTRLPVGGDHILQDCAAVYASDVRGGSPGLLVSGWPQIRMNATTLDHSVWLHRPFRPDEWFHIEAHAETTSGCRSLTSATMHDLDGSRVATYVQTTLVRPNVST